MTNTTLAEAMDIISDSCGQHPRILTAMVEGKTELARNILELRICNLMDDFVDSDLAPGMVLYDELELVLSTPGPLLFRAMKEAAARTLDKIRND